MIVVCEDVTGGGGDVDHYYGGALECGGEVESGSNAED